MKRYKVEFLDDDGDLIIEFINVTHEAIAHQIALIIAGHKYYTLTLTGV